jgi:heterodisulfide reductase subunit C
MAFKEGYYIPVESIEAFHKVFLRSVEAYGRLYEIGFAMDLNLQLKDPLKDADLGPVMMAKGKLKLRPHKVKDLKSVKKLFENVRKLEESRV